MSDAERLELYGDGHTDSEIARRLGLHHTTILLWRRKHGLPPNAPPKLTAAEDRKRLRLYRQGLSDRAIAKSCGCGWNAIKLWRRARGLPAHPRTYGPLLSPEMAARRMLFYQLGWSDTRIGRETNIAAHAISAWRDRRGLRPNFESGSREVLRPAPGVESLVPRVRRAVGNRMAPDIVEETVAELCMALLDGRLALAEIEREARRYGNRTLERFASRYGPRSLDETLGEDDFTLMDTLVDDRSSSWLEEMGATVW